MRSKRVITGSRAYLRYYILQSHLTTAVGNCLVEPFIWFTWAGKHGFSGDHFTSEEIKYTCSKESKDNGGPDFVKYSDWQCSCFYLFAFHDSAQTVTESHIRG